MKHVVGTASAAVLPPPPAARRWLSIVLALAIGIGGFELFRTQAAREVAPPSLPPLRPTIATCSHPRTLAHEVARQREQTARLRWERAALEPAAALDARADMEMVAACYRAVGEGASAQRAAAIALEYARAIERERRHQQLRLQIATRRSDDAAALQSILALRGLLRDTGDGAYVRWLAVLQRELEATGSSR